MQPTCRHVPPRNGILLDYDGFQSQLARPNRRHISARPAPDNRYVVLSHAPSLSTFRWYRRLQLGSPNSAARFRSLETECSEVFRRFAALARTLVRLRLELWRLPSWRAYWSSRAGRIRIRPPSPAKTGILAAAAGLRNSGWTRVSEANLAQSGGKIRRSFWLGAESVTALRFA